MLPIYFDWWEDGLPTIAYVVINRPGVAGPFLQTPLSLIESVILLFQYLQNTITPKP